MSAPNVPRNHVFGRIKLSLRSFLMSQASDPILALASTPFTPTDTSRMAVWRGKPRQKVRRRG